MKRLLVFLLLFTIHDNFAQYPSHWKEDNPYVLSFHPYIQFINDSIGWVMPAADAPDDNAIFKTTDGGDSWFCISKLNSALFLVSYKPFFFTDADTGYYFTYDVNSGQYYKIWKTVDGGISWTENYVYPYQSFIQNYFFLNGTTGWIINTRSSPYAQELLKTTNGGVNWSVVYSYPYHNDFVFLTFFNENVGLRLHKSNSSFLEKTTDGGLNWNTIYTWSAVATDFKFKDENNGYVIVNGILKKTTNGGNTWSTISLPGGGLVDKVETFGDSVLIVTGSTSYPTWLSSIYASTNSGNSWINNYFSIDGNMVNGLNIINPNKVFIALTYYIIETTNFGTEWNKVPIGPTFNLESIIAVQGGKPFAVGWKQDSVSNQIESAVVSSPPLWRTKSTHASQKFNCLSAKNNFEIFIGGADFSSGNNSLIVKCNNEGNNLDIKYNSSGSPINSISFADTNLGFAVGDQGVILKTLNGGNIWTQEPSNAVNDLNIISFKSPLGFIAGSNGFLIRTINDGIDWTQVNLGTNREINSVCIQDQNRIWVVGDEGLFMFSSDGGVTWSSFSNYSEYNFNSIIAIDRWAIGVFGGKISDNSLFFIESHNGGLSWQERLMPPLLKINNAYAKSEEAWAVGDYGTIIFSDSWFLPVELTTFIATLNQKNVDINWQTATELNNQGFEIQRKLENSDWATIGFRTGKGTTTEPTSYFYEDDISEISVTKILYRLKQIDFDGTFSYSDELEVVTQPFDYALLQNYPNPFNPETIIKYEIPQISNVKIEVFDVLGRLIKVLVDEQKTAGRYEIKFDASSLTSGIYYYRIKSNEFVQTKKMMLIK